MPSATAIPPAPRRDASRDLAAAAYAHACAVLGEGVAALEVATLAVRRGGRSRSVVLGHARNESLGRESEAIANDPGGAAPSDLEELAHALAFTRPAIERAIVDLDTRHGLDHAGLGRALGLPPTAAAARVAEVGAAWQRDLDPVLLAYLGPSGCDELTQLLEGVTGEHDRSEEAEDEGEDEGAAATLGQLLGAGRAVAAHVEVCETCRDRLRAMVSVRTLLASAPVGDPPESVLLAAATARGRATAPPALGPVQSLARRRWPALAAVVAAVAVAIAGGSAVARRDAAVDRRVEALTQLPAAGSSLSASPGVVDGTESPSVRLRNRLDRDMSWDATADKPWLLVEPLEGVLAAASGGNVVVAVTHSAPEGELRGTVTFTGDDGSTAIVRVRSTVNRPPDTAAERVGCEVRVTVQDESEIDEVVLHHRVRDVDDFHRMRESDADGTWVASLPEGDPAVTWWITATDALGNETRTSEQSVPDGDC